MIPHLQSSIRTFHVKWVTDAVTREKTRTSEEEPLLGFATQESFPFLASMTFGWGGVFKATARS